MPDHLRAKAWATPLAVFAVLAATLCGGAFVHLRAFQRETRERVDRELSALADVKVAQVVAWREHQVREWSDLLANSFAMEAIERVLAGDPEPRLRMQLLDLLEREGASAEADCVELRDGAGELVLATRSRPGDPDDLRLLRLSRERGAPVLSDLERDADGFVLAIARPAQVPGGEAGLIVRFDLQRSLTPIALWRPRHDSSTEALIARVSQREVVPLSLLPGASAGLSFPIEGTSAIARAARGETGVRASRDRYGREVLAAVRRVPGSTWVLAVKADAAELLAPAHDRTFQLGVAVVLLLLLGSGLLISWWRGQVAALRARHGELSARAARQRFDALWTQAHDIVLVLDSRGALVEVNDRAVAVYGRRREELIGTHVVGLRTPAAAAIWSSQWAQAWRDGHLVAEAEHRRADGSTFPIELSLQVVPVGEERFAFAVCRDVTERNRAARVAREHAALLANMTDAVMALDRAGVITAWAGSAERMYGWTAEEAVGRLAHELIRARFTGTTREAYWAEIERCGTARAETVQLRKGGTEIPVEITATALRDAAGRVVGAVGVNRDLTEQRRQEADRQRLQSELVFADRLASIGTLSAGVAHEINNPLSYLLANLDFVEQQLSGEGPALDRVSPSELVEALRESRDGARRIGEIVRGLRTFSRKDTAGARRGADVRTAADAAVRMAQAQARPRARLVTDLRETAPVSATEHELAQVVLNLVMNAIQAIPEGAPERNEVRVTSRVHPGGRVELTIGDTGSGIAPEHLSRIFDPFFTTKPVGEGSGLGLAICHGLVDGMGGVISVESELGRGTTFTLDLPPATAEQTELPLASPPGRRRGRILIVDDEPLVLSSIRRTLEPEHEVETLSDPRAAVERLAAGEHFDLVVCDLVMPELSGMDCYEELSRRRPDAARRMVFLTGGAFTPRSRAFLDQNPGRWMEKPFDPEALRTRVAAALAAA
ncbi:ATP-binding response regulator [Anaeromyxobacter paludicola]|uniref:histidine kinase n=1 Tax=Anaeromyxobacter paludicola TaxID=2918171 RepID=A0ABN6NA72_9BACT|nr:PAS domain S-box protein [Anaeromyxobacter paludicola]BDG10130.1 hypothetical protein AMPC_32430 [Anaeromyxobacter paludicola]